MDDVARIADRLAFANLTWPYAEAADPPPDPEGKVPFLVRLIQDRGRRPLGLGVDKMHTCEFREYAMERTETVAERILNHQESG
ncbi:hypothetical protein NDU88_001897 [Pleurodeles waltl]|uniref:Uncharacterized protein n=1 Tax=Pleurodeles waltl TaxID=8319 RepID=A0AAV7UU18_PLEWA|nr:hypothetical protein NDU88_001897 [Pleurodeles waltl]